MIFFELKMVLKKLLFECLNNLLAPMRERRAYYEQRMDEVRGYLRAGTQRAREVTDNTLLRVKQAMGIYQL